MKLTDQVVNNFAVGRVFRNNEKPVNSMCFTHDGTHLLTGGDDGTLQIYSSDRGDRVKILNSQKYGVDLVRTVHSGKDSCVVASKNEVDNAVRYWDLWENKFVRYFNGHNERVNCIDVHPYDDTMLTSGADSQVILWDIRKENPVAKINGRGNTYATFDQQGLVFAVSSGIGKVHLFDSKNYDKGEFASFSIGEHAPDGVRTLKFSPCGKYLLVQTKSGKLFNLDAFDGELVCEYAFNVGNVSPEAAATPANPAFSPDSNYLACGAADGSIHVWNTTNGSLVKKLSGHPNQPSNAIFCPTRVMLASADKTLAFWIPKADA